MRRQAAAAAEAGESSAKARDQEAPASAPPPRAAGGGKGKGKGKAAPSPAPKKGILKKTSTVAAKAAGTDGAPGKPGAAKSKYLKATAKGKEAGAGAGGAGARTPSPPASPGGGPASPGQEGWNKVKENKGKLRAIYAFEKKMKEGRDGVSAPRLAQLMEKLEVERAAVQLLAGDSSGESTDQVGEAAAESPSDGDAVLSPNSMSEFVSRKPSAAGSQGSAASAKFKAAAKAVIFTNRTKRAVRFQKIEVRAFNRASSFWDHEFWDEGAVELSRGSLDKSSHSLDYNQRGEASWVRTFESEVALMPRREALQEACDELVEMWITNGFATPWMLRYGLAEGLEAFYIRLARHPAVALMKLAEICDRPESFFLDDEGRKEVALESLYQSLADRQDEQLKRAGGKDKRRPAGGKTKSGLLGKFGRKLNRFSKKLGDSWGL